jgi:hypothetical protein
MSEHLTHREAINICSRFNTENPPTKQQVYHLVFNIQGPNRHFDWKDINVLFPRVRTDIILNLLVEIEKDGWLVINKKENDQTEYVFLIPASKETKPYTAS